MMITNSMIRYYADCLKSNVIDRKRLILFIMTREDCTFDEARDIKYDVLCLLGEEL